MVGDMDVGRSPIQLSTSAGPTFSRLTIRVHLSMKLRAWASDSLAIERRINESSQKASIFSIFRGKLLRSLWHSHLVREWYIDELHQN